MHTNFFRNRNCTVPSISKSLFRAAALVLFLSMSLPAHAGGDRAIKSRVSPNYPEIARRMKISGVVKMEATVDAEGKVTAVKTLEGNRMLSQAAEDAVHKWRFAAGEGVETVPVEVNFAIAQ
jgi:TonB family protein